MIDGSVPPSDGEVLVKSFSVIFVLGSLCFFWLLSRGKPETVETLGRGHVVVDTDTGTNGDGDIATGGHDSMRDTFDHDTSNPPH